MRILKAPKHGHMEKTLALRENRSYSEPKNFFWGKIE